MTRTDSAELTVTFRVCLSNAPPREYVGYRNIIGGIQRKTDVLPGEFGSDGLPYFSGELRARRDDGSGTPVFLGPFTFGPPSARFLYVSWSAVAGEAADHARAMFRRMKVPLAGIAWSAVESAASGACILEAVVPGTARDGGPACATVAPPNGWRLVPLNKVCGEA